MGNWTWPVWEEFARRSDRFAGVFASSRATFDVAASGESRFVEGLWGSGGFFVNALECGRSSAGSSRPPTSAPAAARTARWR